MKQLLLALMFIPVIAMGQLKLTETKSNKTNNYALTGALVFLSGASYGVSQTVNYHYAYFKTECPAANDQYWDVYGGSWRNKYKNGDPAQGEAFLGSTSIFSFATDGYHLTRTISHLTLTAAMILKLNDLDKRWWMYPIEFIGYSIAYSAGFHLTYTFIFNKPKSL